MAKKYIIVTTMLISKTKFILLLLLRSLNIITTAITISVIIIIDINICGYIRNCNCIINDHTNSDLLILYGLLKIYYRARLLDVCFLSWTNKNRWYSSILGDFYSILLIPIDCRRFLLVTNFAARRFIT